MTKPRNLLFIHGFNSSPKSLKAQLTKEYMQEHFPEINFICPQLNSEPFKAVAQLEALITSEAEQQWCLVGSSLGGFFATYLANKYDIKAVLINPAVRPYELSEHIVGQQYNPYTDETYFVSEAQVLALTSLEVDLKNRNNFMVLVQTGDEVLDYQKALKKYHNCRLHVEEGGDHSFINFSSTLPRISDFLI